MLRTRVPSESTHQRSARSRRPRVRSSCSPPCRNRNGQNKPPSRPEFPGTAGSLLEMKADSIPCAVLLTSHSYRQSSESRHPADKDLLHPPRLAGPGIHRCARKEAGVRDIFQAAGFHALRSPATFHPVQNQQASSSHPQMLRRPEGSHDQPEGSQLCLW